MCLSADLTSCACSELAAAKSLSLLGSDLCEKFRMMAEFLACDQLPKLNARVWFSLPAPAFDIAGAGGAGSKGVLEVRGYAAGGGHDQQLSKYFKRSSSR